MFRFARVLCVGLLCSVPASAETTLRVALESLPVYLANPHRTSLSPTIFTLAAMFDTLTQITPDGQLAPCLAVSWESTDALTWRFHLRKGVTFSNGTPLTAEAFVVAVDYLLSDEGAKEGLSEELSVLKSARVIDDLTLEIVTNEPVAAFPRFATAISAAEPNLWRKLGREGFSRAPVGTGPFKLDTITANRWQLSAVPTSWRPPRVDKLELLSSPEPSSRVQALASGRVDVAMVLSPDNIETVEATGARVQTIITTTVHAIAFMTTKGGPFADARVRRALNMAVDRDRIVKVLFGGRTVATSQPATRLTLGYDPAIPPYPHDPKAAKALLKEAGFANGLTFTLEAPSGGTAADSSVYQQIQADLRAVGVTMNIAAMPNTQFLLKSVKTDFTGEAFSIGWASWPSLDVLRSMRSHSCLRPVPWYCDKALLPLMTAALGERDPDRAVALRQDLSRRYHDQATSLFLYELPIFVGLSPRVADFEMTGYRIRYDRIGLAAR